MRNVYNRPCSAYSADRGDDVFWPQAGTGVLTANEYHRIYAKTPDGVTNGIIIYPRPTGRLQEMVGE